jgi:hypothetical protein
MNFPIPHSRTRSTRRWRVLRGFTALALVSILFAATSVQAGPVTINQVVQTLTSTRGPAELNLLTQDPANGPKAPAPTNGPNSDGPTGAAPQLDKLLSGMTSAQDPQNVGVEVVEEAEVEGTICDCGFIPPVAVGGIPKWPFLFLAAVPLVFIHDCQDCDEHITTPTPTPPPNNSTPTPAPTPEPASLLLFGSGLVAIGASLRRRYAKTKE